MRPVFDYSHFTEKKKWVKLEDHTKSKARKMVSEGGEVWNIIVGELGIPLVPIKDSFNEPLRTIFTTD